MIGAVIILLGVSGIGKSTLSREIQSLRPDILCLSAGTLLRKYLRTTSEALRTAEKQDIEKNQWVLAIALANERRGQEDRPVLLEAHSFIDNDQEFVDVPVEIIASLKPAGIILISTTPNRLARQRERDDRVRPKRTLSALSKQIFHSRELALYYAKVLRIPNIQIENRQFKLALDFINSLSQ
ncbi:AAA family ATPase [Gluconobacter cerinus]|uniref:ATP-binding protein n=1 Tax=Gluconobacter cerinus TaxID=38307 RepID=UPI00193F88A5|nr:AAA family ATPase [Gluconobacter cerinus]MBM3099349.1 AAA family ATPase [Gluconobacter cerinus]